MPDWRWSKRMSDAPTRREAEYAFGDHDAERHGERDGEDEGVAHALTLRRRALELLRGRV